MLLTGVFFGLGTAAESYARKGQLVFSCGLSVLPQHRFAGYVQAGLHARSHSYVRTCMQTYMPILVVAQSTGC